MALYKVKYASKHIQAAAAQKQRKEELFKRILKGDKEARELYIKEICVLSYLLFRILKQQ